MNTIRRTCPVEGCDWHYDEPPLSDIQLDPMTLADVFGVGAMAAIATSTHKHEVERALREHLETHSLVDWVRTTTNQAEKIRHLEAEIAMSQEPTR